jgi:hypothetical protein
MQRAKDTKEIHQIAASEVDVRAVVWIREFLLDRTQGVRVGGQISEEVKSDVRSIARKCFWSPVRRARE